MSEIEKFKQGAEILQQVDVTDIISSLAVGIADAQEQLDNNSIKQALALADPNNGIGGKSLLSMGFAPAFYHFQYADVSAEIALKMRLQTEFELDASLSFNYTKQGGYSADKLDYLQENSNHLSRKEHKSSRSVSTSVVNYEDLTIESEKVKMSETHGSVKRIEDFADQIRSTQKIDRVLVDIKEEEYEAQQMTSNNDYVFINSAGGYVVVTTDLPDNIHEGVLKVTDYNLQTPTDIEFDSDNTAEFSIGTGASTDFTTVYTESVGAIGNAGYIVGFQSSTNNFFDNSNTGKPLEVYFDYDKSDARLALQTDLVSNNFTAENSTTMRPVLEKLAKALRNDPDAEIRITGHTDGSGRKGYNELLSKKRSKSLHDWFVDHGVKSSQIKHTGTGETIAGTDQSANLTFRKAVIEFISSADYFYYAGGNFDGGEASPTKLDTDVNKFIYAYDHNVPGSLTSNWGIGFQVNNIDIINSSSDTVTSFADIKLLTAISDSFTSEIIGNSLYLLHNERQIKYSTFSKESETQRMAIGSREEENFSDKDSKYMISEVSNTKTKIKKDQETRKNPSTIAVGASVDIRVARQFEMDVSGNSKVSARLVSLPAPPEFLDEIKSYYNQ